MTPRPIGSSDPSPKRKRRVGPGKEPRRPHGTTTTRRLRSGLGWVAVVSIMDPAESLLIQCEPGRGSDDIISVTLAGPQTVPVQRPTGRSSRRGLAAVFLLPEGDKISYPLKLKHASYSRESNETSCGFQFEGIDKIGQRIVDRFVYFLQREARRLETK